MHRLRAALPATALEQARDEENLIIQDTTPKDVFSGLSGAASLVWKNPCNACNLWIDDFDEEN